MDTKEPILAQSTEPSSLAADEKLTISIRADKVSFNKANFETLFKKEPQTSSDFQIELSSKTISSAVAPSKFDPGIASWHSSEPLSLLGATSKIGLDDFNIA
jgi:hypothetical protein